MNVCVCVCGGEGWIVLWPNPPVRFVCQRLKLSIHRLTVFSCIFNPDWLLLLSFVLFVCLVGFLTSSSTTRLYRGRAPRQSVWQFYVLPHRRQSWETMTSISAGPSTEHHPLSHSNPSRRSLCLLSEFVS